MAEPLPQHGHIPDHNHLAKPGQNLANTRPALSMHMHAQQQHIEQTEHTAPNQCRFPTLPRRLLNHTAHQLSDTVNPTGPHMSANRATCSHGISNLTAPTATYIIQAQQHLMLQHSRCHNKAAARLPVLHTNGLHRCLLITSPHHCSKIIHLQHNRPVGLSIEEASSHCHSCLAIRRLQPCQQKAACSAAPSWRCSWT
jgi:hypothetical protein